MKVAQDESPKLGAGDPRQHATVTAIQRPPLVDASRGAKDSATSPPILLHGGGIDSSAVFLLLVNSGIRFKVLHFDYGQPSLEEERKAIQEQCFVYGVPYDWAEMLHPPRGKELVKGRNAALLSLAFTQSNTVYAGLIRDCVFADSSEAFVSAYKIMLHTFNPEARLILPTYELHKGQELALIQFFGGAKFHYWTCNTPIRPFEPCGSCGHCRDLESWKENLKDVDELLKWYPYSESENQKTEKDSDL